MKICTKCKIQIEDEDIVLEVYGQITHCPKCDSELIES